MTKAQKIWQKLKSKQKYLQMCWNMLILIKTENIYIFLIWNVSLAIMWNNLKY